MGEFYSSKQIDFGFVVVCQNPNTGHLKTTVNSLRCNYGNRPFVTVVAEDMTGADLKDLRLGPVVKNEGSLASQINTGIAEATWKEWCMVIQAGTWVRGLLDVKLSCFIESSKDILFPVIDRLTNFVDAGWNGLFIHRQAVKELGPFPENNPEEWCKLLWVTEAIHLGYKFKGIVGAAIR